MITYGDLRELSQTFRRISSSFLSSTMETSSALVQRFKLYIDNTPFISELLNQTMDGVEYNFNECFVMRAHGGWSAIRPPVDEACHVKAMYDYLTAIVNDNANVFGAAMSYYHSSKKFDEIIQAFLLEAFKPLITYIIDAISQAMISKEEEMRETPRMTQNIETVHGTVIQQGTGSITSHTHVVSGEAQAILDLLGVILPSLQQLCDVPDEALENVKDDLASVDEQLKSQTPKKPRLLKALAGIKKFFAEFAMKLSVSFAATAVTNTNWVDLIHKIEEFITSLSSV